MTRATSGGRRVLAGYRDVPWSGRAHVWARWASCPMPAIEAEVPRRGRVLDLGCGHGLFSLLLAATSPERQVTGVDVDGDKLGLARRAAEALGLDNVRFRRVEPDEDPPDGPWDAISIVDVLYLLGDERARRLVAAVADALAPDGVAVIKEMDLEPRWKYRVNLLQELVATRVARITEGDHVEVVPPAAIMDGLEQAGLAVRQRRLHRGRPHPHLLILAHRV